MGARRSPCRPAPTAARSCACAARASRRPAAARPATSTSWCRSASRRTSTPTPSRSSRVPGPKTCARSCSDEQARTGRSHGPVRQRAASRRRAKPMTRTSIVEVLGFLGVTDPELLRLLRSEGLFEEEELDSAEAEELRVAVLWMRDLGVNPAGVDVALQLRRRLLALEARLREALEQLGQRS